MTELTARKIFDNFINLSYKKEVVVQSFQDPYNLAKYTYLVSYDKDSAEFIHAISGIPKDTLKQFVTLNQFRYVINNFSVDVVLEITVINDYIAVWLGNHLLRHGILRVSHHNKNDIKISYTYRNQEIDDCFTYEVAYNKILSEINRNINPEIMNNYSFLKFHKTSADLIIQSKIDAVNVNYISHSQFCRANNKPDKENIFFIMPDVFYNFIKDMFPKKIYKKLLQLISLCDFNFYLADRDINHPVKIIFPSVSKYLNYNTIVVFEFKDITLSFSDNGEFYYEDPVKDIPVYLYDIDEIYEHLLNEACFKISAMVGTPRERLTSRDIQMFKIMVY